ncbi:retrotransposon protein, putative, ty1-copia subclass [Tanacetum coccineum]|uniref:Retrotransposon protein, putative, ty1-copia subclass n=1 Tax=Tanacetum coccineum TaxID=301880 RepID=A0ABQ5I5F0_9ASTR
MRETCVDLQPQGNCTLFCETMALPVQNINHSAFRSMFEKEKFSSNNFNDWFARLKLVLRVEKKMHVIEQPLSPAPEPVGEPDIVAQWTTLYDAHTKIACLMLGKEGKPVADYVLKMKGYVEKLERLGYVLPQDNIVGLILNGLTKDFVGFVRNYNMHNMGKTIGEIHAMRIEYEKDLPKKAETPQVKGKGHDKKVYIPKPKNPKPTAMERPTNDDACYYCKEVGHWKKNCPVYLAELLKKKKQVGSASSLGIFTIELFSFPNNNSWVYDTGCGTHICITKQGFRIERKLKQGALYLYVGNGVRAQVEAIGSFDLVLPNGLVICLNNCHYAPTITRGVISVSHLVDNGFVQCFTDYGILVSKNDVLYFNAVARNGIYEIDMHDLVPNHCRLAHINKKRIKQLQQDGLLKSTDDESFDKCESCLSGRMTKKPFTHSNERAKDLLRIIHTDVCGPLRHVSRQGASYFITFTDDYSRYGYVYLLKHKHEVFEMFKVFKNEVENQLGKTIKEIRSDRGGEYISQEFKDYLKANGIVQQLTPPYTPQHNGVSERRNRTLLDMECFSQVIVTVYGFWRKIVKPHPSVPAFLDGYRSAECTPSSLLPSLLNTVHSLLRLAFCGHMPAVILPVQLTPFDVGRTQFVVSHGMAQHVKNIKACRGEYEFGLLNGLDQGVSYDVDLVLIQLAGVGPSRARVHCNRVCGREYPFRSPVCPAGGVKGAAFKVYHALLE